MRIKVKAQLEKLNVNLAGKTLLVGVSGGVDSMVLLHILKNLSTEMGFILHAAHMEHGMREDASLQDMTFVKNRCIAQGISLHMRQVDVKKEAELTGETLEACARRLRYAFFGDVLQDIGSDMLLVAHHMDDQAETILLHMIRGSGLNGLCGMKEVEQTAFPFNVLRPLLSFSKKEIIAYAHANDIDYCIDETNDDTRFSRNRIRHEWMPKLTKMNPNITETLYRLSKVLQTDEAYMKEQAENATTTLIKQTKQGIEIDLFAFLQMHESLQRRVLLLALARAGAEDIAHCHVRDILQLCVGQTGKQVHLPGGIHAYRSYEQLVIAQVTEPMMIATQPFAVPSDYVFEDGRKLTAEWLQDMPQNLTHPPQGVLFISADALPKNLQVRTWQAGDVFHPLGAPGSRLLQDYFSDKKVPRQKRSLLLLIAHDKEIFAVCGMEISQKAKVNDDTAKVIQLSVEG